MFRDSHSRAICQTETRRWYASRASKHLRAALACHRIQHCHKLLKGLNCGPPPQTLAAPLSFQRAPCRRAACVHTGPSLELQAATRSASLRNSQPVGLHAPNPAKQTSSNISIILQPSKRPSLLWLLSSPAAVLMCSGYNVESCNFWLGVPHQQEQQQTQGN